MSALALAAIALITGLVGNVWADQAAPFADERAAMARVERATTTADTEAGLAELAAIRHRHALAFLAVFVADDDPEALREALNYARSAVGLDADNADHWRLLAQVYAQFKGIPAAQLAAERSLERAHALAPDDAVLRVLLAQQLMTRGRYDAALAHWEHLAWQAPLPASPRRGEAADPAARLGPGAELVASLASAYLLDRQAARGVRFFERLRAAHPDVAVIELGLAVVTRAAGEPARARARLTALSARDGLDESLRRHLRRVLGRWRIEDGVAP